MDTAKKALLMIATLVVLLAGIPFSRAEDGAIHEIERFVEGNYTLLGKAIASRKTYLGEISIERKTEGLEVTRRIEGSAVKGTAFVAHATPDKVPVLRIRFMEKGKQLEETCLVDGDLDNYARLTCYLYFTEEDVREPGMEAMRGGSGYLDKGFDFLSDLSTGF